MRIVRLGAVFLLSVILTPASAAVLSGDVIEVKEVTMENIYATGGTIAVTAPVTGDVVAFGGDIIISGPVDGDVTVAGGTVRIDGTVTGDVRVASSRLLMETALIGGDVVYAGSQLAMGAQSSASGAVMAQAGQIILQGTTAREMHLSASDVNFGGTHAGPVQIDANALQFMGNTKVAGAVSYDALTVQDASALTAGSVTKVPRTAPTGMVALANFATLAGFVSLASLLMAGLLMLGSPVWSMEVTRRMSKYVAFSLFLGIFTVFAVPSLLGFMLGMQITFAPWAIVLLPVVIALGSLYVLIYALGLGMIALLFARILPSFRKEPLPLGVSIPLGALVTGCLMSLPYVGLFAAMLLFSLAIGGMVQSDTKYLGIIPRRK